MTIKFKEDKKVAPDKPSGPYHPVGKVKLSHRGAHRVNEKFGTTFKKGDCLDVLPVQNQYRCTCRGGGLTLWSWGLGKAFHYDNCLTFKLRCLLPKNHRGKVEKRQAFDIDLSDIDDERKLVVGDDLVEAAKAASIPSV